jgi:hypothetical protein
MDDALAIARCRELFDGRVAPVYIHPFVGSAVSLA